MPGAYAHLSMVSTLATRQALSSYGLPDEAIKSILTNRKYCEFGAVSPDFPYLDFSHDDSKFWADQMHYTKVGTTLRAGINHVAELAEEEKSIAAAWLFGYISHVITDVTIHPVVNLIVGGEYETHKTEHRICEMHQDAYIFPKSLNIGSIGMAVNHLKQGIGTCFDENNEKKINLIIKHTWETMLHAAVSSPAAAMDFDEWFDDFVDIVSGIARSSVTLPPLARHVAFGLSITYPALDQIKQKFIADIPTPSGLSHYTRVFEKAKDNVGKYYSIAADAIFRNDTSNLGMLKDWNLDTGEHSATLAMW